jgi:Phage replication protein CRI
MTKTTTPPTQQGHVHIDRLTVNGPIEHIPLGELFYKDIYGFGLIPAGASAYTPKLRKNPLPDDLYIKSSEIQSNGMAYRLLFDCCPPQILQGHNFFGHSNLLDYAYTIFERQLLKHKLTATDVERALWRTGNRISLSMVHLTGNFRIPSHLKTMFINAIDEANSRGKHRDIESCITLGFTEARRSTQQTACVYDKLALLDKHWRKPGVYQAKLKALADGSIRVEIRLYEGGLAYRGLKSAAAWATLDVDALFFELLAGFNIANAIQPLLTPYEEELLSPSELITYTLWIHNERLERLLSASTISRHARAIENKVNIDIRSHRRPEKLPELDLKTLLSPANLVPLPEWAAASGRYWAPGQLN